MTQAPSCQSELRVSKAHAKAVVAQGDVSHLGLAVRLLQLLFKRTREDTTQRKIKSWPGCICSAASTSDRRVNVSMSISIPAKTRSTVVVAPVSSVRSARLRRSADRRVPEEHETSWRAKQSSCTNCGRLFFTRLSMLSDIGKFCSLDCKSSYEYVCRLDDEADALWGHAEFSVDSVDSGVEERHA